jgi:hypothetical protein
VVIHEAGDHELRPSRSDSDYWPLQNDSPDYPMTDYLSSLLNALKLPARVIAGLFLFSLLMLLADWYAVISLPELHPLARPIVIIAALGSGALSFAFLCGVVYDAFVQRHKRTLLAARREIRKAEARQEQAEYQAQVLKRLDYLAAPEIGQIAWCLRKNQQTFTAAIYSPTVANMRARGFVETPPGVYNQDRCPFYFTDFVWEALLARKEEFIRKDDEEQRKTKKAR